MRYYIETAKKIMAVTGKPDNPFGAVAELDDALYMVQKFDYSIEREARLLSALRRLYYAQTKDASIDPFTWVEAECSHVVDHDVARKLCAKALAAFS